MKTVGLAVVLCAAMGLASTSCKRMSTPGAASAEDAAKMGTWHEWQDLSPLVEVAKTHAPKHTVAGLKRASELLGAKKIRSADKVLSELGNSAGRDWISVARANLAALHFTVCIRGIAWRLEDGARAGERRVDFSENARVEANDVSVEAMLTNLDTAIVSQTPALATQARIARARVTAFAAQCAANGDVANMAQEVFEADLAALAAAGHLTPDLSYMWAGIQMTKYSGAAARPFLEQAQAGGFDDPSVDYMLAVIALEDRRLDEADALAATASAAYKKLGDKAQLAQVYFIRGEVARARKNGKTARQHYNKAIELVPAHVASILAIAELTRDLKGNDAARDYLHGNLSRLLLEGPLDEGKAKRAAGNVEALVIMATEPHIALLSRDALLNEIDAEPDPMRRGIRYFYAATLDVRLREYEIAHGHGVLAKEEFEEADEPAPIDVEAFLQRLTSAG